MIDIITLDNEIGHIISVKSI